MRIGIFGGTFNPIHNGHLRAASDVLKEACLKKIIFVPSFIPPHRELDFSTPAEKRLEAVRLAISGNPGFEASSFEIDAEGKSYSIRTIEHFAAIYRTTPYFLLGQDAFNDIMSWYEAKRLFRAAHFIVMSRPGAKRAELGDALGAFSMDFTETPSGYSMRNGRDIIFVDVAPNDISSSQVRELVRSGRPVAGLVPPAVEKYIHDERMYL